MVVGESQVDFVDDQASTEARDGGDDLSHLVRRNAGARRIRRRRDQHATRRGCPLPLDRFGGQLIARFGPDRNADGLAFQYADEVTIARIPGIGHQDAIIAIDDERDDEQ